MHCGRSLALSAAVALCGGLSQTTFAADMSVKAPPPPPPLSQAPTWTGCYADAGLGYGVSNTDHSGTLEFGSPTTTDNITGGGRGWLGRFGAGCDYQFNVLNNWNVVAGLFGDYDAADIHGSFTGAFPLGGNASDRRAKGALGLGSRRPHRFSGHAERADLLGRRLHPGVRNDVAIKQQIGKNFGQYLASISMAFKTMTFQ